MRLIYLSLLNAVMLITLVACSTSSVDPDGMLGGQERDSSGFALAVLPESSVDADAIGWRPGAADSGCDAVIEITARDAAALKELYIELSYDPESYTPTDAEATTLMGGGDEVVSYGVLDDRGAVHYGQVLVHADGRAGFSGSGVLARIRFAAQPMLGTRVVSSVPDTDKAAHLLEDTYPAKLSWRYTNPGDYNQDGIVNITDISEIGKHFGYFDEGSQGAFILKNRAEYVIDGNGDGRITINDLTAIGQNWEHSMLGGFRIYRSGDFADYPPSHTAENGPGAELVAGVGFEKTSSDDDVGRRHFTHDVAAPDIHYYYWIRPVDESGAEGTPSNAIMQIGLDAPRIDGAAAVANWDADTGTLSWYYYHPGDFNQDGIVGINDLHVIGIHYQAVVPSDPNAIESVIDYSCDGVVNLSDAEGIDIRWQSRISGYYIYSTTNPSDYPWCNDSPSANPPLASVWVCDFDNSYDRRLQLEYVVADPIPGAYYWVRPCANEGYAGTPSNMVGGS
jgi:hypothetical protein